MSIVKRNVNDETFGQNLSDVTVIAFQNQIHCDASIISAEREEIRAHQVVLAKSPTLKYALRQSEVRYQPEANLFFPEFKKRSLLLLLQFLYTGEVDLISASELLVEFQELCRILKLNPQVKKTKYVEGSVVSGSDNYCCSTCPASFDKASKIIFHQQHCNKASSAELKVVSSNEIIGPNIESEKNLVLNHEEKVQQSAPVINTAIVQDDFVKDGDEVNDDLVDNDENVNMKTECGFISGFQMPDNFDLPDEIIQEQLPAAKYTSTPIRYSGSGAGVVEKDQIQASSLRNKVLTKEAKLKNTGHPRHNERKPESISEKTRDVPSKSKTQSQDLEEKRKRVMQKVRVDEFDIIDEKKRKHEKKGKRLLKDKLQRSSSLPVAATSRTQTTSKKSKMEKAASNKRRHVSSSSSEEEESGSYDTSDEDGDTKVEDFKVPLPKSKRVFSSKKLAVSVQTHGNERIMELIEYKLKLALDTVRENNHSESDDDIDPNAITVERPTKKKKLKLEKVGKRIKRIISTDGDSSEDSLVDFSKKPDPVDQPRPASPDVKKVVPSNSTGPPMSPEISKLPKIPKIQRDPISPIHPDTHPEAASSSPKPGPSNECDFDFGAPPSAPKMPF